MKMDNAIVKVKASYYQQFDADYCLAVPAEGYGGWKKDFIEISLKHTAFVIMHAWETGTYSQYPGWYRAVEYLPRAQRICKEVFPLLLPVIRKAGLPVFHVVGGGDYYKSYPGYARAIAVAGSNPCVKGRVYVDPCAEKLQRFRYEKSFPGSHNTEDINKGFANIGFAPNAEPVGEEYIAENGHQLFCVCQYHKINHLIYLGFAINWCVLMSPGGMQEMSSYGVICSVIKDAVTAVENRESARNESHKEEALWRVAIAFGFVFESSDIIEGLKSYTH